MSEVYKYELYCETEGKNVYDWGESEPTQCPIDSGHTVDLDSISIVETVSDEHVEVTNFATIDDTDNDPLRVVLAPGHAGYYMCDRDVLLKTGLVENANQDLKVNTSSHDRVSWNEVELLGCFKEDGTNGYVPCTNQTDANSNAVLSVWEFLANDQNEGNPIAIEFKGGSLFVDDTIPDNADKWEHQVYGVLAPDLPSAVGGTIRFFDGYLYPHRGSHMETINTIAMRVDPAAAPAAMSAKLRIWIYYPAGTKNEHILRLVTFRNVF